MRFFPPDEVDYSHRQYAQMDQDFGTTGEAKRTGDQAGSDREWDFCA